MTDITNSMTFLGEQEGDMKWLHEVHNCPVDMTCAIVFGNEDFPERIEAWREFNPEYQITPDWIFDASKES